MAAKDAKPLENTNNYSKMYFFKLLLFPILLQTCLKMCLETFKLNSINKTVKLNVFLSFFSLDARMKLLQLLCKIEG